LPNIQAEIKIILKIC